MKEKIIAALKTAYAKLGLSDEAFDGVASLLEKTVTEESEIATAVGGDEVKGLLKTIQGQVDSWKNKYHDKDKELKNYKESHKETNPTNTGGNEEILEKLNALSARLDARDAEDRIKTTVSAVRSRLEKDGCTNKGILNSVLKGFALKENESEDEAVERIKLDYNQSYKDTFGSAAVPGAGSGRGTEEDEKAFRKTLSAFADSKGLSEKQ